MGSSCAPGSAGTILDYLLWLLHAGEQRQVTKSLHDEVNRAGAHGKWQRSLWGKRSFGTNREAALRALRVAGGQRDQTGEGDAAGVHLVL